MQVGDKVITGVYVCGKWTPVRSGIITERINEQLVRVDVGSLHGCSPWITIECEYDLRLDGETV